MRIQQASRVRVQTINGEPKVRVVVIGLNQGTIRFNLSVEEAELVLEDLEMAINDVRRRA